MALTVHDLAERLRVMDEVTLLELLDISSEEIIDRFGDYIEEHYDTLVSLFEEIDEEDDNNTIEF